MTRPWLLIAWGILILTIVDGAYSVAVSSYMNQEIHNYHEATKDEDSLDGPVLLATIQVFSAAESFIDRHEHFLTVLAAIAVAIFTFTLWQATIQLKIIAKAQVDALVNLERPWLFLEKVKVTRREGAPINPNLINNWFISFQWRNVGRAPAVIKRCIIFFEPTDELPILPNYSNPSTLSCPYTVAKDVPFETPDIGPAEQKRTRDGEVVNLTVYGRLTYSELNGDIHHTGFSVDVSPHLPAFSAHKNRNYDYYN